MQLSVTGKQIDIGQALRQHVEEALDAAVDKYFGNAMDGNVVFAKEASHVMADISVHVGKGILIQAHASSDDPYIAFDTAVDHMAKRLRRYKRRLRDHHRDARQSENISAQQFILSGSDGETSEDQQ